MSGACQISLLGEQFGQHPNTDVGSRAVHGHRIDDRVSRVDVEIPPPIFLIDAKRTQPLRHVLALRVGYPTKAASWIYSLKSACVRFAISERLHEQFNESRSLILMLRG